MTIRDYISRLFARNRSNFLRSYGVVDWGGLSCLPFGELVFANLADLITDLANDVTWTFVKGDRMTFAEFDRFFKAEGVTALWRVIRYGFAVVGYTMDEKGKFVTAMRLLNPDEWRETTKGSEAYINAIDPRWRVFVMKSQSWAVRSRSDYDLCFPAIKFLDNTMNASNTAIEKMGAFIVASPETAGAAPTPAVLNPKDKKDMEEEISKEYGLLNRQRQIMLLPRGMNFQTINLTGIDTKLVERVRLCVEIIADRLRVPASQVAVIDATAGKSLSNGGEVHEGDRLKYATFERLLVRTFMDGLAPTLGLAVTYNIYNKPADAVTGAITQEG